MSVRVLFVTLIVLLAANLGMAIWYRMGPPEASQSEDAPASGSSSYDLQYYDDNAGTLPPPYYYAPGTALPFYAEFQGGFSADADFTLAPDLYAHAATLTVARIVDGETGC